MKSKAIEDPNGFADTELKTVAESWRRIPELASKAHSSNLKSNDGHCCM